MVTFAAGGDDAFLLNPPISGQIKDATVRGTQLLLRSALGYKSAAASAEGGSKAFKQATKFLIGNMLRSITKKLEIELLYGQMGYGTVTSTGSATSIVIPVGEWAPGIWGGAENMPIEVRDATGAVVRGNVTITAVDFDTRTITINSALTMTAGDVIWHKGAYGNEFAGIHKIISNTGSLFGIDAAQYTLWKGNTYSAGSAALSFNKIQDAIARAVEKGLDSEVMVLVNPKAWADLLNDQAALRMYDQSYSSAKSENGAKELAFHGQNGKIEIVPSIYVKESYAYVLSLDEMMRIGVSDVTFKRPGRGDDFFRELNDNAGYEMRVYTDQALFCHAPGKNVLINLIVN
jgi:hypothetical protein